MNEKEKLVSKAKTFDKTLEEAIKNGQVKSFMNKLYKSNEVTS